MFSLSREKSVHLTGHQCSFVCYTIMYVNNASMYNDWFCTDANAKHQLKHLNFKFHGGIEVVNLKFLMLVPHTQQN